jgi:hypothetical protein
MRWTAWCAVTNSNPWTGSRWSPVQTRPRLLRGSPVLHGVAGSLGGAAVVPPALPSSGRPCAGRHRAPPAFHPVPDRLGRGFELLRQFLGCPPFTNQLNDPLPELRRIRPMTLRHRGRSFPPQPWGVHETGSSPDRDALYAVPAPLHGAPEPPRLPAVEPEQLGWDRGERESPARSVGMGSGRPCSSGHQGGTIVRG